MNIVTSFDQPISSLPTGFVSAVNYVVKYYDELFTDPITMNIAVGYGEILGTPVTGAGESAGRAVGFSSIPNIWDFTPGTKPGWSQYDFAGAVEHEFSECMGRVRIVPGAQAAYNTSGGDPWDWQFNGYDPFNAALDPGETEDRLSNADLDVMQKVGWQLADPFDPNGSDIARLYYGLLNREPDYAGLDAWKSSNLDITSVANSFLNSTEYAAHGTPSNVEFVAQLYEGALGRAPELQGLDGWVTALEHGTSRADVAVGICESPESIAHNQPLGFTV